ncbi:hypothetical protein Ciccas_012734 [Cichlidogyrus casuarinus]|uniref:Uncharacterized protein n=1 Tax=Cichlidogyrus casuarinus TaxID=1844966 RepID=A0ABD2PMJ7_9PLAT
MAASCPGILYAIIWLLALLWIAWPIAGFASWIYILLVPFQACASGLEGFLDTLLKVMKWPLICAQNCMGMKDLKC